MISCSVLISEEGDLYSMNFSSCDVRKALDSVSGMIHKGKKDVIDLDDGMFDSNGIYSCGSYIEDKMTGKRTKMREENGNYLMDLWVMPKHGQGFQRQR